MIDFNCEFLTNSKDRTSMNMFARDVFTYDVLKT